MPLLERLFAASYDRITASVEKAWLGEARRQMLSDLAGRVLEIGVGTGANFQYYPPGAQVTAIDRSPHFLRRARPKAAAASASIGLEQADAQDLPFDDDIFDAAVATLVLCTIPDPARALAEVRRVTRDGAPFLMIEHVQAATPGKRLLLNMWNPCQKVIAGGCNINRNTEATVRAAGFQVDEVQVLRVDLGISPNILIKTTNIKTF